jgi:hypothetical protein
VSEIIIVRGLDETKRSQKSVKGNFSCSSSEIRSGWQATEKSEQDRGRRRRRLL